VTQVVSNRARLTTYFRRSFVADPANVGALGLRLSRDDGAVVYLNGTELWRDNMPAGIISYTTPASSVVGVPNESVWWTRTTNAAPLVNGTNIVAVKIHQNATNSSDVSFDFALTGVAATSAPALTATMSGNQLHLTWPAWAAALTLATATNLSPPVAWHPATNTPVLTNGVWLVPISPTGSGQRAALSTGCKRRDEPGTRKHPHPDAFRSSAYCSSLNRGVDGAFHLERMLPTA